MLAALLTSRSRHALIWLTVLLAPSLALSCAARAGATPVLDTSFGSNGFATPSVFPQNKKAQTIRGLALQSSGKLVVPMTLHKEHASPSRKPVIRLNLDGSRDWSYGDSGVAWIRVAGLPFITLRGVKTMPGDGTLVWGFYQFKRTGPETGFFVAKLDSEGHLDSDFGVHGARRFSLVGSTREVELNTISPTIDGGAIVAYNTYTFKDRRDALNVTRLSAAGSTDRSFGDHGTKVFLIDRKKNITDFVDGVVVSGNLMYVSINAGAGCDVRRYVLSASVPIDTSFGANGHASGGPAGSKTQGTYCAGMNASASGSVLIYGDTGAGFGRVGFVRRLKYDGSVDEKFNATDTAALKTIEMVVRATELPGGEVLISGGCHFFNGCVSLLDSTGGTNRQFGKSGTIDFGKYAAAWLLTANGPAAAGLVSNDSLGGFEKTSIFKLTN